MIRIESIIDEFRNSLNRHNTLKGHFHNFQTSIELLGGDAFPLRGISVTSSDETSSTVTYLDREYEFKFSTELSSGVLVGRLTVARVIDRDRHKFTDLASVTFNGESVVDIQQPQDEDPIRLDHDNDCMSLVMNWIRDEFNA